MNAPTTQVALESVRQMLASEHDVTIRELGEFLSHVGLDFRLSFAEKRHKVVLRRGGESVASGTGKDALAAFRNALLAAVEAAVRTEEDA